MISLIKGLTINFKGDLNVLVTNATSDQTALVPASARVIFEVNDEGLVKSVTIHMKKVLVSAGESDENIRSELVIPNLIVDGPVQSDFALNRDMLKHKFDFSKLAGQKVNVLVFPNLDSANGTYKLIKELNPNTAVEALTPDFKGLSSSIDTLVNCGLEVFAQNIETVERLTHQVRDIRAGYLQTLDVLSESKRINPNVLTKTSIILGLGETDAEIEQTMDDLIEKKVDILTIGQYLRPTRNHHPIERWVTPEEFEKYRKIGLQKGFLEVVSGPMVRSSYRAERALEKNNAGLG